MTNIVLINPRISEESQSSKINAIVGITFPSSLGTLAGCLHASGFENVRIIDEQIDPLSDEQIVQLAASMDTPKIIGLSVLTLNSGRAYELARKFKAADENVITVLGGIHPTVATDEVLHAEGVDIVVRGEGDVTFPRLVEKITKGQDLADTRGISILVDGEPRHNPPRELVSDLDEIPPFPYHLFEKNLYRYPSFSSVTGSRGCPHACIFCSSRSISGKRYRHHSVERIISECKTLIEKYEQPSVFFMDDNIAVNKKMFMRLCQAIIDNGLHEKAYFHGSMRGDNATDEILETAKKANFKIIYFGFETGSERLMTLINKGETVAQVVDAIKRAHAKGLSVGTTLIFGLPTETPKERWDSMRLAHSLPIDSVRFNTLTPYPGTPAYQMLEPQGKILIKENWSNFGVQYMWESDDIPYVPDGNTRLQLMFDTMYANVSYYLAPKGLWRLITSPVAGGNVIKLKQNWFLSLKESYKLARAFIYLFSRFLGVAARRLLEKLAGR